MEEKRTKKEIIAVCLLVLSLLLIVIGTTFAFFQYSKQGTTVNKLESGTLTFIYDENRKEKNGVSLTNAFPMSDTDGVKQTGTGFFEFQVRSEAKGASIYYEIYLTKDNSSTLPEYTIKTYLTEVTGENVESGVSNLFTSEAINLYSELGESQVPSILKQEVVGKTLYQGSVNEEEITKTFRFRMWIDNDANQVRGGEWIHNYKTFSVKVNVYAQNSSISGPTDSAEICNDSNVNEPKLVEGMIPVYYDYEEGTWKKANAKTANWYNYCNQEWANAVTVVEKTEAEAGHDREYYQKAEPGTPILIDDINTMWVWIPRYEYYIPEGAKGNKDTCLYGNVEYECYPNSGEIEINFINGTSKQESDPTNYKVHSAFTFGEDELTGFWYGKFETSTSSECEESTETCNKADLKPYIKPNAISWRYIQNASAFIVSQKMMTDYKTEYGFTGENMDTHLSKNSEWGAVAYLSQSQYGKYGNDGEGVFINNCMQYITGIAGNSVNAFQSTDTCSTNTYNTEIGQKASTTGNITGIYDMSGGSVDRVMGALEEGDTKKPMKSLSGFTDEEGEKQIPDAKYYDLYISNDLSSNDGNLAATACDGYVCYGHALSETLGWNSDSFSFLTSSSPWLSRGGAYGSQWNAGVFSFNRTNGGWFYQLAFRLVLAPRL